MKNINVLGIAGTVQKTEKLYKVILPKQTSVIICSLDVWDALGKPDTVSSSHYTEGNNSVFEFQTW